MNKHKLNFFPEMLPEDYARLKDDIDKNGYDINYPIWFYEGQILDGWNREKACNELNIEPVYAEFTGSMMDAIEFVMRSNKRRNLTSSQWACIAVEAEVVIDAIRKEAKERQGERNDLIGNIVQLIAQCNPEENKTRTKVAELFNTNRTYIDEAQKLKNKNPVLFNQVKNGEKTITAIKLGGLKSSESVEWYTPEKYIEAAREVMGSIDLDPASSKMANEIVKATKYLTQDDDPDGLNQEWYGNVWINPPYGKGSGLFTTKLIEEFNSGRVNSAILLLNAYGFDTIWFQPLWNYPICFTDHRVEFYSPLRESGGPANANIFIYLGSNPKRFRDVFKQFGHIVILWKD